MNWRKNARALAVTAAGITAASLAWFGHDANVEAADHNDPSPRISIGTAEDIADLYAWPSANGATLTVVLTFAGPQAPVAGQTGTYDPDVLYGIHIDNDGDHGADHDIWMRFGQSDLGAWGVQVSNLPGETGPVEGAVETTLTGAGGAKVYTGLRDDPFFFDLDGFTTTLQTGTLSFDGTRDSFAGANVTTLVLEIPVSAAIGAGTNLSIWATSSRI